MIPGLQWFIRFYGRLSPARRPLPRRAQMESAADIVGWVTATSLELRSSPEDSISSLREFVHAAADVSAPWSRLACQPEDEPFDSHPPCEIGLVFHFTKDRGGGARDGTPRPHWNRSHADPFGNPTTYRYARYYHEKYREALTLASLLRHNPLMLDRVRGLDVCTDELGVPNWVLVPLIACVREAAEEAATAARRLHGRSLPSLRMTAHAGEDFVHLLTGLRYVDEAIEYFPLREGDRIGHGIALGIEPREWAQHASRLPVMREERLFDLVWQWSWYGRAGGGPDRQRQYLLDYEIAEHSERLFGQPVTPYDLESLRQALFAPDPRLWQTGFLHRTPPLDVALDTNIGPDIRLSQTGFPDGPPPSDATLIEHHYLYRLCRYLRDPTLFERGREVVWVAPGAQGEELVYLQGELRRKVGLRGITVEVNPTSNLLIGDLGDLTGHPLWRLRPPRPGSVDIPPVAICIGSDDPVVFGSDLREELSMFG